MTQDNIVNFAEQGAFEDPLSEVLRNGARKLLADAIEAEVSDFLGRHWCCSGSGGNLRWRNPRNVPKSESAFSAPKEITP